MISPNQAPSTPNSELRTPNSEPLSPVYHRGSISSSREQNNPLRSLTISRAISLMESAQRGDYLELQWLYNFLEQTYDVLIALQERRYGRLDEMGWETKIIPKNRRRRSFDQTLAEEQAAALAEMYDRIDNLKEAISHTASATFRMYSHLNIQRDAAGEINHLEPLDQWNFLRNGMFGDWYWNPEATITNYRSLPESNKLVPDDFIIRTVARHIDRPGLIRYIRSNLAVKDWSGFIELFGIPTPIITMPAGATESQKSAYEAACSAIAQGRPVALPNGSTATFPDGTRGNEPFSAYLKWCDEQMVLIGTGGLLTMLSMPQGIGSGSSDVHDAAFQSIAKAEAYRISEIFQRQLDKPFLARAFPGKPILAYFEIAAQEATDPGTILEHATKANTAGFQMDPAELSEMTGYKLSVRATPVSPSLSPFSSTLPAALNSELRTLNSELSNTQLRLNAQDALARAMAEDLAPVRARIEEALALEDDQAMLAALQKLQADMPDLLTSILAAPAAEQILEDTTTAAMINGIEYATNERTPAALNFDPSQPRDENGRWSETGDGGMSWTSPSGSHHQLNEDRLIITPKGRSPIEVDATKSLRPLSEAARQRMQKAGKNPDDLLTLDEDRHIHVPKSEQDRFSEANKRATNWRQSPDYQRRQLESEVSNNFVAGDHPTHPRRRKMADAEKKLAAFDSANPEVPKREEERRQRKLKQLVKEQGPSNPWTN